MELLKQNDYQAFVNSVRLHSKTQVIENASEDIDLLTLAKDRGIDVTKSQDLSFIKHIYALTDEANLNQCRLPKENIALALSTIVGKPIDIDHIRRYVIGHYLGAELKDNVIYAYGVIYKANFEDEWEKVKDMFASGELATSFEIWCPEDKRQYNEDGTVSLLEPVIAGGAVLFSTKPACPQAKVLEVAKKNLDNNVMYNELIAASFATAIKDDPIIISKVYPWDLQTIQDALFTTPCPSCKESSWNMSSLNFDEGKGQIKCLGCGYETDFEFNVEDSIKLAKITGLKINNQMDAKENSKQVNDNKENAQMDEKIKELEAELATLKAELEAAKVELASKDETIQTLESAKSTLDEEVKAKVDAAIAEAEVKIAEAKEQTKTICARKSELGEEISKDMSEADILDDTKFELAKIKKENAELKAKIAATPVVEAKKEEVIGASVEDDIAKTLQAVRDKVNQLAFTK